MVIYIQYSPEQNLSLTKKCYPCFNELRVSCSHCSIICQTQDFRYTVCGISTFHVAKFMFCYNHMQPSSFLNLFITGGQVHTYAPRFVKNYRLHFCRTNIKQFTLLYLGPKIWNSLPLSVSSSTTFAYFKKRLYDFLSRNFETD